MSIPACVPVTSRIQVRRPRWNRRHPDWGERLGYSLDQLESVNRRGVAVVEQLRAEAGQAPVVVISGCIGPRDDAYWPAKLPTAEEVHDQLLAPDALRWCARPRENDGPHGFAGCGRTRRRKSHAELNASEELDEGNAIELAQSYRELALRMPSLTVLGGCCGTDHRHVRAICEAQRGETHTVNDSLSRES